MSDPYDPDVLRSIGVSEHDIQETMEYVEKLRHLTDVDDRPVLEQITAIHNRIHTILKARLISRKHDDETEHFPLTASLVLMDNNGLYFIDTILTLARDYIMGENDATEEDSDDSNE